ncbi:DNA primase, partial [hydrothermal vent metagenome]
MRFTDTFLEDIRQRLPISQVVGQYVAWDKRKSQPGRGDYWACCPFHGEKTPSFHADDRRGRYHCFGCSVSGDHFRFLTEHAGMSFPEAVEKLAGEAGMAMPARDARQEQQDAVRATLYDVMEMAAQYFEAALAHNIGARARGYLNERQVSPQMQARFRLGFAPDSRGGLKEHLAANGINAERQAAAGLVVNGADIAVPYDRFRNRIMFPIFDFKGRVIAFGGRALSSEARAKYLNSPESELFHKRQTLYNGQMARKAAQGGKQVIVVEGYLDVIALVSAGFEGALAPLGTALSQEHVGLLWRMSEEPVLCFDGDEAGQRAMARTCEIILPALTPGKSVVIATLPEGMDPDDLIREHGAGEFGQLIERARPLSEMVWSLETGDKAPKTPEARAALEARLRARANAIGDQNVRRHYQQAFDEKLRELFAPAYVRNSNRGARKTAGFSYSKAYKGRANSGAGRYGDSGLQIVASEALKNSRLVKPGPGREITAREAVIIMSLLNHPALVEKQIERLAALEFRSQAARKILSSLIDALSGEPEASSKMILQYLEARGFGGEIRLMRALLASQGIWQSGADIDLGDAETGLNHALALHYKSVDLNKELKSAELALGQDPSEESFERLRDIQNQITSV